MTTAPLTCRSLAESSARNTLPGRIPQTARESRSTRRRHFRMRVGRIHLFDFLLPTCPRCCEPVSGLPKKCACCHEPLEGNPAWMERRKNSAWVLLVGPLTVFIGVLAVWPHA